MTNMAEDEFQSYGYPPAPFDVEDLDRYRPGGYHPIILGDMLGTRFEVIHKLGFGSYATVWLCFDHQTDKWRAVKVVAASHSNEESSELSILKYFQDLTDEDLEKNHICLPREHFFFEGPNGRHLCIVMPLLGAPLEDIWTESHDDFVYRHISRQMAEAMAFIHSRGVCHGDFRPRNIMSKIKDVEQMALQDIMSRLPETGRLPVPPPPSTMEGLGSHLPKYIYPCSAIQMDESCIGIAVCDFGEAYHISDPPLFTGIPAGYAPPETMLSTGPLSFAADIWALANSITEIRLGMPFMMEGDVYDYLHHLEELLGPLPEPYRTAWFERGMIGSGFESLSEIPETDPLTMTPETMEYYREDRRDNKGFVNMLECLVRKKRGQGRVVPADGEVVLASNERYEGHGHIWTELTVPEEEADQLLDLLQRIFKYDPNERPCAAEVLSHPWFEVQPIATISMPDEDLMHMHNDKYADAEDLYQDDSFAIKVPDADQDTSPVPDVSDPEENESRARATEIVPDSPASQAEHHTSSVASLSLRMESEEVVHDAGTDRAVAIMPPPAVQGQNGIFDWIIDFLARLARGVLPRLHPGPMTLGDLHLYP